MVFVKTCRQVTFTVGQKNHFKEMFWKLTEFGTQNQTKSLLHSNLRVLRGLFNRKTFDLRSRDFVAMATEFIFILSV